MDSETSHDDIPAPLPSAETESSPVFCAAHPGRAPRWSCTECHRFYCAECVQTVRLEGGRSVTLCRACHAVCEPIGHTTTAPEKDFAAGLLESFTYPFRGSVAVVFLGVVAANAVLSVLGGWFMLLGLAVGVYTAAFLREILLASSRGQSTVAAPEADMATLRDAAVQFFAVYLVCFGPFFIAKIWLSIESSQLQVLPWTLLGAGAFCFPMALLAVVIYDNVAALNPVLIVLSIAKVPLRYLALLLVVGVLSGLVWWIPWSLAREGARLLASILGGLADIYAMVVFVRALGWFYYCSEETLSWS